MSSFVPGGLPNPNAGMSEQEQQMVKMVMRALLATIIPPANPRPDASQHGVVRWEIRDGGSHGRRPWCHVWPFHGQRTLLSTILSEPDEG
jgi:hypothetical protein